MALRAQSRVATTMMTSTFQHESAKTLAMSPVKWSEVVVEGLRWLMVVVKTLIRVLISRTLDDLGVKSFPWVVSSKEV